MIWLQSSSSTPTVKCLLNTLFSSIQQVIPVQKEGTLHLTEDDKTGRVVFKSFLQSTKKEKEKKNTTEQLYIQMYECINSMCQICKTI